MYFLKSAKPINCVNSLKKKTLLIKTKSCRSDSTSTHKIVWHRDQRIHISSATCPFLQQYTEKIEIECVILEKGQAKFQPPCMQFTEGNALYESEQKIVVFCERGILCAARSIFIVVPKLQFQCQTL